MTDMLFVSRTARFDLPFLFAGQFQKEVFVNEIAARLDALLQLVVEDETGSPPTAAADGTSWLIGADATGEWSGREGQIASRQSGNWLFTRPGIGMRLYNKARSQDMRFTSTWTRPARPASPTGGSTIDAEARSAIDAIIGVLATMGAIPEP